VSTVFKFRASDQIGAAGAEEDEFLSSCYVDTGDLSLLKNLNDRRSIVLGRTGTGKSALLAKLEEVKTDHVIRIFPENLALTYVSNSTILNYVASLGVNLDPFFKLLWRHVLTVEILLRQFQLPSEKSKKSLLDRVGELFTSGSRHDQEMNEAIDYLKKWGKSYWLRTEYRVKEITQKVESDLGAELNSRLGIPIANIGSTMNASEKLTLDQRAELHSRCQDIISEAQVQDLNKVMKLLDTVLEDRQNNYYIIIDRLDEGWVEDKIRYKLIMALIQTARDFTRVKHAKVIIALRRDLIDRVFRLTRESGFQEEKYRSLYLPLHWKKEDIMQVLDLRIGALVSRRYTIQRVTHKDLMPKKYLNLPIDEFIFQVAKRPRDVIDFFNTCILAGANSSKLNVSDLRIAEGEYSRNRLRALGDEWSADYPCLLDVVDVLKQRTSSFKLRAVTNKEIEVYCLRLAIEHAGKNCLLHQYALKVADCVVPASDFKLFIFQVFYRVGLVGLKLESFEKVSWVDELGKSISTPEISEETSVIINPTFYRALGIKKY
jgi:hypothetical protein